MGDGTRFNRAERYAANASITPTETNVPKMDRPSIAFAWFLDSMAIDRTGAGTLVLVCTLCEEMVCDVEETATLRVLLNTALAHDG